MTNIQSQYGKKISDSKKIMILNAARALISKFGVAKTTLDDISNSIGLKKSSLYYYYKNKEDLIEDVIRFESNEYYNSMIKKVDEVEGCINKIVKFVKVNLSSFGDIFPIVEDSIAAYAENKKILVGKYLEVVKRDSRFLSGIIKDGISSGELKKCDNIKLASSITTIIEAIKFREFHNTKDLLIKNINFKKAEEDIVYIITLLFDELTTNIPDKN